MKKNAVSEGMFNLSKFNLNLLTIFCLIYSTRSITQVSQIMGVTPSSVSQYLSKLRLHFHDPLFTRHGNTISPTVFSDDLYLRLDKSLKTLSHFVGEPVLVNRREKLVIYSPFSVVIHNIPSMIAQKSYVKFDYNIKYIESNFELLDVAEMLNMRKADIAFSAAQITSSALRCIKYREFSLVLVCRKDHPFDSSTIDSGQIKNMKIATRLTSDNIIYEESKILNNGMDNDNYFFETNSLIMFLSMLSETDYIGFMSREAYIKYRYSFNLRELIPLFKIPKINVFLSYRKDMENKQQFTFFINALLGMRLF